MNKVTTVNLNGNAFQLEESGYDALRTYLDRAAATLAGNPDRDEIISDIEQAIADRFRALLNAYKTVVTTREVENVIATMGPIDGGGSADSASAGTSGAPPGSTASASQGQTADASAGGTHRSDPPRRLYRLREGAMMNGVCNGLAAYFHLDPTLVRVIAVAIAFITFGGAIIGYLLLTAIVPEAQTPEQKDAAHGTTTTAAEFIRRAKQGYYEGIKSMPDREARRAWRRKMKQDMRTWGCSFQHGVQSSADQLRGHWYRYWAQRPPISAAWSVFLPFLTILQTVLSIAFVSALVLLLARGVAFGLTLPASLPTWLGLVLFVVVYSVVVLPLKAVRHFYRCQLSYGAPTGVHPFVHALDGLIGVAALLFLLWIGFHHLDVVKDAFHAIPPLVHDAVYTVARWWHGK